MNYPSKYLLYGMRKIYLSINGTPIKPNPPCEFDPNKASEIIGEILGSNSPGMIARFGGNELDALTTHLSIMCHDHSWIEFIKDQHPCWWWSKRQLQKLHIESGIFPLGKASTTMFCERMILDIPLVDVLGSWQANEARFSAHLSNCRKVQLELLNPYFAQNPWTKFLENKSVLVIHPFTETIASQYLKREQLFKNNLLPKFELRTIQSVMSSSGENTIYSSWNDALEGMKTQMDQINYDIALIGCGAYGFPLAAHAKRSGKIGFHLGGSLQLLFGIRGKRWDNPNYHPVYDYSKLINEHWVRPSNNETPKNANDIEGATYW